MTKFTLSISLHTSYEFGHSRIMTAHTQPLTDSYFESSTTYNLTSVLQQYDPTKTMAVTVVSH